MIVHNVDFKFEDDEFGINYFVNSELRQCALERFEEQGVEELWYYYGAGSYEGTGYALMRVGDKWDGVSLGHCSCNDPGDDVTFCGDDAAKFLLNASAQYLKENRVLLVAAGLAA